MLRSSAAPAPAGGRLTGPEEAQAVALSTVAFLLADEDRAARFLAVTGLGGTELGAQLRDAGFLGGVLDFVLEDEPLLLAAAQSAGVSPERMARLRQHLPGGMPPPEA